LHAWILPHNRHKWVTNAYTDYTSGKQTLMELSVRYGKSVSTLRRHFELHLPTNFPPKADACAVALSFDATFFGRGYGLLVYRALGRNLYWQEIVSETTAVIRQGLLHLHAQGWQFSSFTIDGRRGVVQLLESLFPSTPVQLCLFHQKASVRRYTTTRPKTPCGKEMRQLMAFLIYIDEQCFLACIADLKKTYADFLKERNEQGQFKHRRLRSALRSLTSNAPYLYTWKRHPEIKIPTTTNSCDGSFAHWKNKVKIHRGLRKDRRAKMIAALLAKT
jgi:hypothetical protein